MRVEWSGYEDFEDDDSPSFEKIMRQKPRKEYEERQPKKKVSRKHTPREDKE